MLCIKNIIKIEVGLLIKMEMAPRKSTYGAIAEIVILSGIWELRIRNSKTRKRIKWQIEQILIL